MTGPLTLTLAWFLLSIPCSVLIGRCIKAGRAEQEGRPVAGTVQLAVPEQAEAASTGSSVESPALPTQRGPVLAQRQHAEVAASE